MEQRSGKNPGGDGRVRGAFGDSVSGVNRMSDSNGVGGSGGGNAPMAIDATGVDGASGGEGAQTLEQLMATILRDAWQGDAAAAGSGNVNRDDVTVRSNRYVQRFRQLCQEKPDDDPRR